MRSTRRMDEGGGYIGEVLERYRREDAGDLKRFDLVEKWTPQAHFSLLGELLPASLEIAEVARTTAGRPLSSALLESTWSVGTRCYTPRYTLSYPQRLSTFDSELGLQSLSDCFALS